ncbi:ABC transporter ATP-binding protein [Sporosarcina sp. G11-34]|uniref:ABC transporter ATP-binding protein n=1 Tax=Sporosarcina sp. G11-34 TaxID=2849605 RepID=UPI0022A91D26|nr:energy-coupling factor transporter ATPase [Sporosarcina sp. G11-34]MCZ2260684.1 ATP-binding cassette domain-containing protein [Sporosarcina sp. G11-34]
METIKIENLRFQFPDASEWALQGVNLTVKEGEFIVICGPSGCGKTTLLQLLKNELAPAGTQVGEIYYKNSQLADWDKKTLIEEIGFVSQDPENQIVMDEVMQEIVFGLENLGYSNFEMRKRVAEMVNFFGMEDMLTLKPSELSGGQTQMLNLLSTLLLKPKVLLLDEPTSQLDPIAARELLTTLERLNQEMGITIILVEHRLEQLFSSADRILFMEEGAISYGGASRQVIEELYERGNKQLIPYLPSLARLYMETTETVVREKIPLTVKEGREWFVGLPEPSMLKLEGETVDFSSRDLAVSLKDVYFQYRRESPPILKKLSLEIREGDFFALVGGNGSGKTTVLKACIGSIKTQRGKVLLRGENINKSRSKQRFDGVAYLPQNPRTYFVHDTIEKEMRETVIRHNVANGESVIVELLQTFGIAHLKNRHPYDCSGGEIQKTALACMLIATPEILFIDEPTKGLDSVSKEELSTLLQRLHKSGITIIMVTHDIEFAAKNAMRCAMIFNGEITVTGTPAQLFKGNYFYTTSINRASRVSEEKESLTLEEALLKW